VQIRSVELDTMFCIQLFAPNIFEIICSTFRVVCSRHHQENIQNRCISVGVTEQHHSLNIEIQLWLIDLRVIDKSLYFAITEFTKVQKAYNQIPILQLRIVFKITHARKSVCTG
jgi:hypothetical protein